MAVFGSESESLGLLSDPLGKIKHFRRMLLRRAYPSVAQENSEFVPANPADDVASAKNRLHEVAQNLEHLVAGRVPPSVVDKLEAINVQEQQTNWVPLARCPHQRFSQR